MARQTVVTKDSQHRFLRIEPVPRAISPACGLTPQANTELLAMQRDFLVANRGGGEAPCFNDGKGAFGADQEKSGMATPLLEFLSQSQEAWWNSSPDTSITVTVLFTDIVGSTSFTQRLGDEVAHKLVREHDETVRAALAAFNGKEIKHTGDGIMALFCSGSNAVRCALRIQSAFADRNKGSVGDALKVRIGLNTGEPIAESRDYFGTSVQLARRLCDRALPGTVLAADVVRQLVAGKGFDFQYVGSDILKGFDQPVPLYEVRV